MHISIRKRPSDWRFAWPLRRRTDEKTIGLAVLSNAIALPTGTCLGGKSEIFLCHCFQWVERGLTRANVSTSTGKGVLGVDGFKNLNLMGILKPINPLFYYYKCRNWPWVQNYEPSLGVNRRPFALFLKQKSRGNCPGFF
jgi:hypothetical protein